MPAPRFDDRAASPPVGWTFAGARGAGRADRLEDVRATIADAEREAREHGRWVALVVAYEAAPAFEPAMRTHPRPPAGTPFVAWWSYDRRVPAPPLPEDADGPPPLAAPSRRAGVATFPALVDDVRGRIARGDVFQVNVADRFEGRFAGDPDAVYAALLDAQRTAYGALVDLGGGTVVASASPELLLRWEDDVVVCRPMKGTIARRPRPDDDEDARRALLASTKDRAENVMIVDLLRNDLSRLTVGARPDGGPGTVDVVGLCDAERYDTVWQLTSTLRAAVRDDASLVDVLAAVFPCGSVTGAPKIAATDVIAALEAEPRGVYCGAIGMLAPPGEGPRAVLSVPIRTAVLDVAAGTYVYGAGGGITWSSDPVAEEREVEVKTRILTRRPPRFDLLETLRLDADGLHHRDRHLDRIAASAAWFGRPLDRDAARSALDALGPVTAPHRVRLLVDRDGRVRTEALPLGPDAPARVAAVPSPDAPSPGSPRVASGPADRPGAAATDGRVAGRVVRLAVDTVVSRSDDPFLCHKTTWREPYDAARSRHPDADDVLLVNEHGRVVEATIANLVVLREGRWWTPPLTDGGLAGVGRAVALEAGLVAERSLPADELDHCDALGVLSALRGFRPAVLV
ncbi:MAG: chorismate-binding protein [Solirubrobacteraceae bacterium]|nr:chorismate-binding protein [Solirubrobacteraceae bacterium]